MLLAIDVGNTHTVLGLFDGDDLVEHWRIATESHRTADEIAVVLHGLLAQHPGPAGAVTSTGSRCARRCRRCCTRCATCAAATTATCRRCVVEPGVRTGVPVLTDNPKEVGTDRVVNALAAVELFGGPCVVVDFGTATTFDAVSAKGEYLGGAIAPGIEISVEALGARGAQLRRVELARPRSVIGRSTVEALQAGILYGFAGQVDGVVTRMVAELVGPDGDPDDVTVIATGGLAPLVLDEATVIDVHEPWLTLVGLRMVFERNPA